MDRPKVPVICIDHWPGKMISTLRHPAEQIPIIDQMATIAHAWSRLNEKEDTALCESQS